MMKNRYDNLVTGLAVGFLFPLLCFAVYAKYRFPDISLTEIVTHVQKLDITATMLSLCVFFNLFVFFAFLWKKADQSARGVLTATVIYAILVVALKFFG